jgi:hypothetical protein
MPPVYAWLAGRPGDFAILELPLPAREPDEGPRYSTRTIYSLYHGKALIDGGSAFVPADHALLRRVMQNFPAPGTVRAAARAGARYVVVHYGDFDETRRAALRRDASASAGLTPVATFGDDVVYELR